MKPTVKDDHTGITFRETMTGGFALGTADPETGAKSRDELSMHATIAIHDIDAFIKDPQHKAQLTGKIDFKPMGMGMAADRGVFVGTVVAIVGATLLSVPFWHAPALVHWGGQGVGQALFSSTLAVWRAKGAFLVYALSWFAVIALFGFVTAVGMGLLGVPQMAGVLALPAGLVFSTVFYVSLIFSFNDSFGQAQTQTPAQAAEPSDDAPEP